MMSEISNEIINTFGNKLRIRVCGVCFLEDCLLLIKHKGLGVNGVLWAPPGGGMEYGESATNVLIREFKEETNLIVEPTQFLFTHEFLSPPLHAIELFYKVNVIGGSLMKGNDPEMSADKQIIEQVKLVSNDAFNKINKPDLHHILKNMNNILEIINYSGYFLNGKSLYKAFK